MKECPSCAGTIQDFSLNCTHCGAPLHARSVRPRESLPVFSGKMPKPCLLWTGTVFGAVLFATMSLGAFHDSHILKVSAQLSAGIVFFLVIPFSWWLNGLLRKRSKGE